MGLDTLNLYSSNVSRKVARTVGLYLFYNPSSTMFNISKNKYKTPSIVIH